MVSRDPHSVLGMGEQLKDREKDAVLAVGSIEEGLRRLQGLFLPPQATREGEEGREKKEEEGWGLGRVFVIGGAQIYKAALGMRCCERVLWTRVGWEGECDVFFPEGVLPGEREAEGESRGEGEGMGKWVRRSRVEMERWVGEEGVGGLRREGDVEFEVCMLERVWEGGSSLGGEEERVHCERLE